MLGVQQALLLIADMDIEHAGVLDRAVRAPATAALTRYGRAHAASTRSTSASALMRTTMSAARAPPLCQQSELLLLLCHSGLAAQHSQQ